MVYLQFYMIAGDKINYKPVLIFLVVGYVKSVLYYHMSCHSQQTYILLKSKITIIKVKSSN